MKPNLSKSANPRSQEMPDIFEGAEKKKRPATVTVLKPLGEVFAFFTDFSYLARAIRGLDRIEQLAKGTHRWHAQGEAASWETELVLEEAPHRIAWRTRGEGTLKMVGALTFEPALDGRATVVSLKLAYPLTAGKFAGLARRLRGEAPDVEAATALRRLKALLEAGEIPTTQGQPTGREESAAA